MRLDRYLAGYATPLVARPGQRVAFHLSAGVPASVRARVVRLACLNLEPAGPPERIEAAGFGPQTTLFVDDQRSDPGARLEAALPSPRNLSCFTFGLGAMPTLTGVEQKLCVLGSQADDSIALLRDLAGILVLQLGPTKLETGIHLPLHQWVLLSVTADCAEGWAKIGYRHVQPGMPQHRQALAGECLIAFPAIAGGIPVTHIRIAAGLPPDRAAFDGRIDLPILMQGNHDLLPLLADDEAEIRLAHHGDLICAWSFRASPEPCQTDLSPARILANATHHPLTGVKGARWTGETHDRRLKPAHYSAVHCNSDAMTDAQWRPSLSLDLPDDVASGVYALEMIDERNERAFATFFVSAAGAARSSVAFLAPTLTYMAYANAPEAMRGPPSARGLLPAEILLDMADGAFGRSLYERFRDGSGVVITGEHKPMPGIGPDFRLWGLPADMLLTDWLERSNVSHDLITDHDLHHLGAAALQGIRVLITGAHPEYWTTPMWDTLSAWLAGGGRLLYLGGNGFYWRTSIAPDGAIEVRRAEDGTRPFIGEPAEYVHSFSDEVGGLWRRLGRPPQSLAGVGMAAQGFSRSTHYRKGKDAADPAVAFVFDGVNEDRFGKGGLMGGGASGYEIDRYDVGLGSDPKSWWLASSENHAEDILRTKEELLSYVPPFRDSKARSDMILSVNKAGGAVFSVGSIAWIGSLADPSSDGAAARITLNVIRRFSDDSPLPMREQ